MEGPRCIVALVLLVSIVSVFAQQKPYKLCVDENKAGVINNCRALNRTESQVNCVIIKDSVDCALKLQKGEADFAVFSAEEGVLASKFINDVVKVTHELRSTDYFLEPFAFQTVAIVRNTFTGGLDGLRGQNYCHPGFKDSQFWNDWVLKYFESVVVRPQRCDTSKTTSQNELDSIKDFFSQTCRPGTWVHNTYVDNKLKRDYKELCSLCDNPGEGCSYNNQLGDQQAAIRCVTRGQGTVAYVALQSVRAYFGLISGTPAMDNPDNYMYLCENGTTQSLRTNPPCAWVQQPWNFIAAKTGISETFKQELTSWLSTPTANSWQSTLSTIILEKQYRLTNASSIQISSITDHVQKGRKIPMKGSSTCKEKMPIRWCTLFNETAKCNWMSAAALTHGITPEIDCVQGTSKWDCFQKIRDGQADFMGIDSNLGYITRHTYDLTTQLFQETLSEGEYQVVAIIDNTKPTSAQIKKLSDLRNKQACFPEYGGVAWVSFVETLRKQNILPKACPYGNTVSSFFSSVCAPGANDPTHDPKSTNVNAKLCSLCRGSCNATVENKWYGDEGAFMCLRSADVAFMNGIKMKQIYDTMLEGDRLRYSVLCADGTKQPLSALQNLDESCPLIRVVGGEVIGRRTRSKIESADFYLALLEMDDWFGLHPHNFERVFQMFGEFDGKKNLIFKEETVGLINFYDRQLDIVKDYVEMKSRADQCGAAGATSVVVGHATWILAALLAFFAARQ